MKVKLTILLFSIFLINVANAQDSNGLGLNVESYLKYMPEKLRNGLKEYKILLGLEKYEGGGGGSNEGIVSYNNHLLSQNKCFNDLAANFYLDIEKEIGNPHSEIFKEFDKGADSKKKLSYAEYESKLDEVYLKLRPEKLTNSTENNDRFKTGWVWDRAVKHAKGNNHLAITLIGICGHDNTSQLESNFDQNECREVEEVIDGAKVINFVCPDQIPSSIKITSKKKLNFYKEKNKQTYKQRLAHARRYLNDNDFEIFKQDISENISEDNLIAGVKCPDANEFYLQGGLGGETLLNDNLVNKISSIQAPKMGGGVLPSKYYHTIGAAYLSCSLKRGGIPNFMIKKITQIGVNTYRNIRLCEAVEESIESGGSYPSENDFISKLKNIFNKIKPKNEDEYADLIQDLPYVNLIYKLVDYQTDDLDRVDLEILREKYRIYKSRYEAAKMIKKYIIKDGRCNKPLLTESRLRKIRSLIKSKRKCNGLQAENCQAAKQVLKTWLIDFDWSKAQHLAGANFAIKHCSKQNDYFNKDLESESCKAIGAFNKIKTSVDGEDADSGGAN